ncbi:hypothetical protein ACP8Y2_14035 [Herpetosiphon llansteffanensis]
MNNRRLALLMSLCAVLFGFAVAKQPALTSAKVLLTQTPSGSTIVPSMTVTPTVTATPCPTYYPLNRETEAHAPNVSPTRTTVPTPNYHPCYVHPALVLSGPSQVVVGQLFTLSIAYENIGMQHTTIRLSDDYLARFDPPLTMPCKYDQHPTRCQSITLRATSVGVLVIEAQARGESFNNGWFWSTAGAKTPLTINIIDPNATSIPTATCVVNTAVPTVYTATPTPAGRQIPNLTQTPLPSYTATPNPCAATPTFTPTPTLPSYPCYTPTTRPAQQQAPQVTQAPCTPTPTASVPCVTPQVAQRQAPQLTQTPTPCVATPTFTPTPTFPSYPCYTPTTRPMQQAPQVTQAPCTPTPTFTPTPTVDGHSCDSTPGDNQQGRVPQITQPPCTPVPTAASGSPTVTPVVKELILSAPNLVNVGDAFSLTIEYVNIGAPYTGITLSPTGTVQFDPPLTMPCKFNEHPTQCRTIGLRAIAPGTIEIDAGATGEVFVPGVGWYWGSAQARNPITVRVLVLDHKAFIPIVKTQ